MHQWGGDLSGVQRFPVVGGGGWMMAVTGVDESSEKDGSFFPSMLTHIKLAICIILHPNFNNIFTWKLFINII